MGWIRTWPWGQSIRTEYSTGIWDDWIRWCTGQQHSVWHRGNAWCQLLSPTHLPTAAVRPAPPKDSHSGDSSVHTQWQWLAPARLKYRQLRNTSQKLPTFLVLTHLQTQSSVGLKHSAASSSLTERLGKGRAASRHPQADPVPYPSSHQKGQLCYPPHKWPGDETQPWPTPADPTLPTSLSSFGEGWSDITEGC